MHSCYGLDKLWLWVPRISGAAMGVRTASWWHLPEAWHHQVGSDIRLWWCMCHSNLPKCIIAPIDLNVTQQKYSAETCKCISLCLISLVNKQACSMDRNSRFTFHYREQPQQVSAIFITGIYKTLTIFTLLYCTFTSVFAHAYILY